MSYQSKIPTVRKLNGAENEEILENNFFEYDGLKASMLVAHSSSSIGRRKGGSSTELPNGFLHTLWVTSPHMGFIPKSVRLAGVNLILKRGWAENEQYCDNGVNLVYCRAFPYGAPAYIVKKCSEHYSKHTRLGRHSFFYLQLEYRESAFPNGLPALMVR